MSYSSSGSRMHQGSKKAKMFCDCGDICPLRIATTPTNRGKKFYSCPNFPQGNRCKFFRWADGCDETGEYDTNEEDGILLQILLENRELRISNSALMLKNREMWNYKIGLIITWVAIVVCLLLSISLFW